MLRIRVLSRLCSRILSLPLTRRCVIAGYANRVIHLTFDELSENPAQDPIWVSLRNPRLVPPDELRPKNVATDPVTGAPLDTNAAEEAMYAVFTKLIIGWRVYDASCMAIDESTGEPLDQPRLPMPPTTEAVAKLPSVILARLVEEFTQAANPQ